MNKSEKMMEPAIGKMHLLDISNDMTLSTDFISCLDELEHASFRI